MITGDFQLMFQDYLTGDYITLGGDEDYCAVRFDSLGSAELRTAEREMPSEDGIAFGYEYLGKRPWTITGAIRDGSTAFSSGSSASAWDSLSKLMRAWDYNRARTRSRDVVPLYVKRPGRDTMVVYGRPERIDPDNSRSYAGLITYSAIFRQSDPKFYSETEETVSVSIVPTYVGGLQLNVAMTALKLPFTTSAATGSRTTITQDGDVSSPLIITFEGPVTNPSLRLISNEDGGDIWNIALQTSVPLGQSVTIDTRQWKRSVLRSDGASLAGALYGPPLAKVTAPQGTHELVYEGTSPSNSSTCTVKVRDAWGAP